MILGTMNIEGGFMPVKIKIIAEELALEAELSESATAKAIVDVLPICAEPNEWGDEFYFEIPITMPLDETATLKVSVGDIGYWPPGNALALFFGPTPMSRGPEPVPASAVNIVGKIAGDATLLRRAKGATNIRIEKA